MAFSASSSFLNSQNPNPLDLPVSYQNRLFVKFTLSVTNLKPITVPTLENNLTISSFVTSYEIFPTNTVVIFNSELFKIDNLQKNETSLSSPGCRSSEAKQILNPMVIPKLVVFDLDGCVWYPEMYVSDKLLFDLL